jgi:hypothetical protein
MLQMASANEKAARNIKKDEQPLDTSRMKPLAADAASKPTEIPAVSNVVS